MPCLSLSSNNASALMDACQSCSLGNAMLSCHQPDVIVPLAMPLFQLPTSATSAAANNSDKVFPDRVAV